MLRDSPSSLVSHGERVLGFRLKMEVIFAGCAERIGLR
jgi:hypothetical protein